METWLRKETAQQVQRSSRLLYIELLANYIMTDYTDINLF